MSEWGNLHDDFHEYHSMSSKSFGSRGIHINISSRKERCTRESSFKEPFVHMKYDFMIAINTDPVAQNHS
jgi:hypothetical protein